jgi:ADP-ribose pyrophosphatase
MIKKWEIIEEKNVSPSKWYPLFIHKVKLPNGTVIDDYYVSKLGDVAMIVAITPNKEIVFVKQYKHGVRDIILELPAGRIDNKSPEQAAKVELEEETGFIADKLISIGSIYVAPSKDSTITYAYLVNNVSIQGKQKLDATEEIEIVYVPIHELDEKIKNGEIKAADTIATITLARINYPEYF